MCWSHWRRVPKALNHAVFDTYREMVSRDNRTQSARAEKRAAYRQARDAAVAAVNAKEGVDA